MYADKDKTSRSGKSADACPVSLPSTDFAFFPQHPYFSGNKLGMDQNAKLNRHQALSSSDSIRILHLRPGSGSETIRSSLEEVLLGETDGRYEAASDDDIVAEDCFRLICDTARIMEQEFHHGWTVSNPFNDSKLKGLPKTAENWRLVAQLFDLTWFHRV
ncbi:hypothetical protein FOXYSP1_16177 [Fusarium oxysporum f. sp. phaseoli]